MATIIPQELMVKTILKQASAIAKEHFEKKFEKEVSILAAKIKEEANAKALTGIQESIRLFAARSELQNREEIKIVLNMTSD